MAVIRLDKETGDVIITQTHAAEHVDFRELSEAMKGKKIEDVVFEDDPRDKDSGQSPRQRITFKLTPA